MSKAKRIAITIGLSTHMGREILRGAADYARRHGLWVFAMQGTGYGTASFESVRDWGGDGVLTFMAAPGATEPLLASGLPLVNTSSYRGDLGVPQVICDNAAIGRLAAEHFLERGFRRFGYVYRPGPWFGDLRREGFLGPIRRAGFTCSVYEAGPRPHDKSTWETEQNRLTEWVMRVAKPVGVMGCVDESCRQVAEVCRRVRVPVPEQVALVGVDNEEVICEIYDPPLSSVDHGPRRVGYEACALLDRLMAGHAPPREPVLVPPTGLVARRSSDVLAVDDPDLAKAIRFIRDHADEPIRVDDVVASVPLSRRVLERRFRQGLGRSPAQEIRRVRLRIAKKLLVETDLPIAQVAAASGFTSAVHFSLRFPRETGLSPSRYRKRFREA